MENRPASAKKTGGLAGQLQEKPLEGLLHHLCQQDTPVELVLRRDGVTRNLYMKQHQIIFAASSTAAENFSFYLIRNSLVTAQQADVLRKGGPVDALLEVIKFQPPLKNFAQLLQTYTGQQAAMCFSWTSGDFIVQPMPKSLVAVDLKGVDALQLIYQGIKAFYTMEYLAPKFAKIQERQLLCTPAFKDLFPRFPFSSAEQELLKRIDSKTTIAQLSTTPGMNALDALRLMWTLFSLRMVGMVQTAESKKIQEEKLQAKTEPVKAAPPKPVEAPKPEVKEAPIDPNALRKEVEEKFKIYEKQNFFELLGLNRKDPAVVVKKTYLDLAKRYHPDALANLGLHDLSKIAGGIFARMTEAHDTLVNLDRRKEYEASLDIDPEMLNKVNDIIKAETEFQKGEIMLRNRSYTAAVAQFETAMRLNPEEAEHHVYLGWARYLAASPSGKAAAMAEAKKMIQKGLGMRGNIDMAYVFLGRLAKANNNTSEAEQHFRKALQINPQNDAAPSEINALLRKK